MFVILSIVISRLRNYIIFTLSKKVLIRALKSITQGIDPRASQIRKRNLQIGSSLEDAADKKLLRKDVTFLLPNYDNWCLRKKNTRIKIASEATTKRE